MKKKERKPQPNQIWKPELAVDICLLAHHGATNKQIAAAIGLGNDTFSAWMVERPTVRYALEQGRKKDPQQNPESFIDYVYAQLPKDLQVLWDDITFWSEHVDGSDRIALMLNNKGKNVRQHLFIHAMVACNFNGSEACKLVGISKSTLDGWQTDPQFVRLLGELEWHKKNFFEQALVDLVTVRNFPAIIHANRTLNRDRGYGDKLEVTGTMQHNHAHLVLNIADLDLPLDVRKVVLDAMLVAEEKRLNPPKQTVGAAGSLKLADTSEV